MSIDEKVLKYEEFLNEKLRTDLRQVHEQRDKLYQQINEYMQLKRLITTVKEQPPRNESQNKIENETQSLKMKMDLGCNFYCQALVPNCSRIYVLIGYGYFLEMTLDQAEVFIEKKIKILNGKCQVFAKDSAKIKAHIKLVMGGLRELQNLNFEEPKMKIDVFS